MMMNFDDNDDDDDGFVKLVSDSETECIILPNPKPVSVRFRQIEYALSLQRCVCITVQLIGSLKRVPHDWHCGRYDPAGSCRWVCRHVIYSTSISDAAA